MKKRTIIPKAVVFDFDGVLVESAGVKTWAFERLFRGRPPRQAAAILRYHKRHAGVSRFRKFDFIYRRILRRPLPAARRAALGRAFARLVVGRVLRAPMVPGAARFLKRQTRSRLLFVVSGTPQAELRRIVRRRGLGRYFRGVFGSPRSKEELLAGILARHRLAPREVLYVGDAQTDWRAARRTGVRFVARRAPGEPVAFPRRVPRVRDLRGLERSLRP